MSNPVVAIVRCPDYETESLTTAISRLVSLIGGLPTISQPNASVFIKINHLGNHPISRAVNTHPELVSRFATTLSGSTSNITIGDGLDSSDDSPFITTGYELVCRRQGLRLLNLCGRGYRTVAIPQARIVCEVPLPLTVLEADRVVSMPKLKTHSLTLLTGAIKNSYGYLPHAFRVGLHRDHVLPDRFSAVVVDVFAARRPDFVLMDAIDALEGNGPSAGGRPRRLGLLLAGTDAVAVDAVASALVGLDPMEVATTRIADASGLGVGQLDRIEIVGERLQDVRCPDFALPRTHFIMGAVISRVPGPVISVASRVARATRLWPRVDRRRCIGCGLCVSHCPKEAVRIVDGKALIDYDECISCFCCQEFCQSDAVRPTRSIPGWVMVAGLRAVRKVKRLLVPRKR